jgi:hypothetical protein
MFPGEDGQHEERLIAAIDDLVHAIRNRPDGSTLEIDFDALDDTDGMSPQSVARAKSTFDFLSRIGLEFILGAEGTVRGEDFWIWDGLRPETVAIPTLRPPSVTRVNTRMRA